MGKLKVGDACTGWCYDGSSRSCQGVIINQGGHMYCDCECNKGSGGAQVVNDTPTTIKQNVQTTDFVYLQNSVTNRTSKLAVENLFPSINVVGKSSESIWISPLLQKNQINLKGITSSDATKVSVSTVDNNITIGVNEPGVDLNNCNYALKICLYKKDSENLK